MRVIVHNHYRSLGKFRATAPVHDHGAGCHCGGACDTCKDKQRLGLRDRFQRDTYEKTNLAIDVIYAKGGYGREKSTETRHYVIPGVLADPRGHAPSPEFVRAELSRLPEHKAMRQEGWDRIEKVEGYYKK